MTAASVRARAPIQSISEAMSTNLAENWVLVLLRGLLAIAFGLFALVMPVATMLALLVVFAAYMLVDGLFTIMSAVRAARQGERWGLLVLQGALSIAVAVITLLWPGLTLIAYVLLVSAWALVSGLLTIAAAFQLKRDHGRWWLALGGMLSTVLGILMFAAPLIGALVMTWWIGAWAIVFGTLLVVLGFKLRSQKVESSHKTMAQGA